MKKNLSLVLALLFYVSILPSINAEPWNLKAKNITGDGTGTISGFNIPLNISDSLSLYDAVTVQKDIRGYMGTVMYNAWLLSPTTIDVTPAFNAAVADNNVEGYIFFPPGRFKVNIVLTKSNVEITGSTMSGDTTVLSRLEPYDITKPTIQIGNDNGTVSGWRLRNLSLQGNHTGTKGLYLAGGATSGSYENIAISYFTEYCLRIQAGATYPTTFNFGDKLFLAPSDTSALSSVRTLLVRSLYPTDSYTTANFINNARIYGNIDNGYALEIDSAALMMSNVWIETFNNRGVKLTTTGGQLPYLYGSDVFIDSPSSSDTLVNWYSNNPYFSSNLLGTISIDGKIALDNGTTTDTMSGRIGSFYQPSIYNAYHTGPLSFGTTSTINPSDDINISADASGKMILTSPGTIRLNPAAGDNTGIVQISYGGGILSTGRVITNNLPTSSPGAGSKELWYDPSDNTVKYAP
jgi:hypothetical protein